MPTDTTALRERLDRAGEEARLHDPTDLAKLVDVENLQVDARGDIVGLDERISDLRKTHPYLFKDGVKFGEDEGHRLIKRLDVNDLSEQEFQDYAQVLTTKHPDIMAIRRLEAAVKRQANDRDAERQRLTRGI